MPTILWVDDEIDLLKPYTIFLSEKGYEVETASNGQDAIEMCQENIYDIVFMDENMPGLSGLDTLAQISEVRPNLPVVMITKSEEENIMDMAIGNKMADYLIKPVNPNQILLTLKKHLHKREIISEQTTTNYRQEFAQIGMQISERMNHEEWIDLYKKLMHWDLKLDETDNDMHELLHMQIYEANCAFTKYIKNNYEEWINNPESQPVMSHNLMKNRIFPLLDAGEKVFMIIIDNFRYDQWRLIQALLSDFFTIDNDDLYYSILPTSTQYARNAICAGLMPLQIKEMYPKFWVDEEEEEGKNMYEEQLVQTLLDRYRRNIPISYHKISKSHAGEKLIEQLHALEQNPLNICVLNFVDMLSHARTDSKMIRELANTESAYRSLAVSWFRHSSTFQLFKELAARNFRVVVTTDHGTIQVNKAIKVVGDKNTNTNLRYKVGKSLSYNKKEVYEVSKPSTIGLPSPNVSSKYIFAAENNFFGYPNNFNYYLNYYKDTFQHGGISMEEMLIPIISMSAKK
ncbi:MAG: PglZ domain-containing protein [bacterium]